VNRWRALVLAAAAAAAAVGALLALLVIGVSVPLAVLAGAAVSLPAAGGADAFGRSRLKPAEAEALARARRRRQAALRRAAGFAGLNMAGGLVRRVVRPDYVFIVYAETDRDKRLYFPRWLERILRPLFPSGLIRFGHVWGMMVAGKVTAETFERSPEELQLLLDRTRERFPDVAAIAMAGRLPSIAGRLGVPLEAPFVRGDRGTMCAMMATAQEQARMLRRAPSDLTIAVPGGGGFIGSQLVPELARDFGAVIAIDPRFAGDRHWDGNVLWTDQASDVGDAQAVLVLTARGEETAGLVPYLAPGAVVADDTHPEIPEPVRAAMERAGATVVKAAVGDPRFRILPRIPIFRSDDIPGCLLEALVVVERGAGTLESQASFNSAASDMGFRARLSEHPSSYR
jgi:hypothetical protein